MSEGTAIGRDEERVSADQVRILLANLARVEELIAKACARAGRPRASVRLLPITKTVPPRVIRLAHHAGMRTFGENKVQEAIVKRGLLADLGVAWTIVGHLQSNKVKHLARFACEFHALDSLRIADLLNKRLDREDRLLDVYIQVNTSGETSKYGVSPEGLLPLVDGLGNFPRLRPRGLMTLAVFGGGRDKARACFRLLRRLRDQAAKRHPMITELSMGMSGDFPEAIEEGADVVRVGQALFGTRTTTDEFYWP